MWTAIMDTEHYRWVAFGSTANGAREDLNDVYGVTVLRAKAGTCLRDGEKVG